MQVKGKILDQLSDYDNRIFSLERNASGSFRITEACDQYFFFELSADDLRALGQELIDAANAKIER